MAQPIRYAVMDDYTLTHLVAPLDVKHVLGRRFDIPEDGGIGSIEPGSKLEREHENLFNGVRIGRRADPLRIETMRRLAAL